LAWRGGKRGSSPPLGIATGHFSFGFAKLIRDSFTGALRFDLVYRQVYAHNAEGIVSGAHRWHSYMGCLKRGWMYTLPVSDVMVRLPELTVPYKLDNQTFNPLDLIKQELALMEARYRTGNGNGASVVTPATSCVKDSNHALFSAIRKFQAEVRHNPTIKSWLQKQADSHDTKRFWRLESLLRLVEDQVLLPLEYVPANWRGGNETVAAHDRDYTNFATALEALKTWKTLLPRRAERELLNVFRHSGATMIDY
jgi:predicted Abi (CAAX) family protease